MIKQLKFASTSAIATVVDYTLFFGFSYLGLTIQLAHFLAYAIASTINFILQKKFIFDLNRKVQHAFIISVSFSIISLVLSTGIIYLLNEIDLINEYRIIPKLITTGIIFFFNFYTKRFAFEGVASKKPADL
ncbi:MAG: putative flippase GtrA [Cyclobacteriaceae bacterium]